jgi:serine/threonine protein kinase
LKKIKTLGEGTFGEVYLIKSQKTQLEYALKKVQLKNTKLKIKRILGEVNILKQLDHPNIISFKGAFNSNDHKFLNIITEYADNGDFEEIIKIHSIDKKYFREEDILNWLFQVCLALQYLHENSIVHRDIKPSNIFLMENNIIKLGDFGLSKYIPIHRTKSLVGTFIYSAPEILKEIKEVENIKKGKKRGSIKLKDYSYEVDIWSLGVTFCHIMSLEIPFNSVDDVINNVKKKTIFNKEKNCYIEKIEKKYSKEFLDLIDKMMTYEPSQRPTVEDILQKDIIRERMRSYLKENEFNENEATKAINNYIDKFGSIGKGDEKSSLFCIKIEDSNEDNLDVSHTSLMTDPLKEATKKFEFVTQLTLINDFLNRPKTLNPNKKV